MIYVSAFFVKLADQTMPIQPLPQTEPQANHLGPFVRVKSKAILGLGRLRLSL
jgi:hypothetical protein